MTHYRIYRYRSDDPFQAPAGWLRRNPAAAWVSSEAITDGDTWEADHAEMLVSDWNDFFSSKNSNFQCMKEPAYDL
jgi:hypothetical protein